MATIFFSHSSQDEDLAAAVETWLRNNGFEDVFIDHDSIRSGDKWTEALRRAKGSCRVVLCLLTPSWLSSDECFGEFTAAWYAGRRIVPLLALAGLNLDEKQQRRLNRVLSEDQGANLSAAGAPAALNLEAHPEIADPLRAGLRAAGALTKIGLDPYAFEVDLQARPEPFPGLESFKDDDCDAAIFFGRSQDIAQCLEDLREMRATGDRRVYAIQGASGSGKSSLMMAGLLPRLRREGSWLGLRAFRPGADPLLNFCDALVRSGVGRAPGALRDDFLNVYQNGGDMRAALDAALEQLKKASDRHAATVLISMDQGEELARIDGDSGDCVGAILRAALASETRRSTANYAVMLTVRSDCFHELQSSPRFEGLSMRTADVRTLPVYRYDTAIEQPSSRYGVEIEPDLVEALMDDAGQSDSLPLLAFTLQRLWRQYEQERRIRKDNYESVGKLSGILEDAAERALRGIDPLAPQGPVPGKISDAKEKIAARVFLPALAHVNDQGAPIRRVAPLDSFDEEGRHVLGWFDKWRLVVCRGGNVEVAHEAMFNEWPRFQNWLIPERARLDALRGVETLATAWNENGRRAEYLAHRGKRLSTAEHLRSIPDYRRQLEAIPAADPYLRACRKVERFRRAAIGAMSVALLGALGAAAVTNAKRIDLALDTVRHVAAGLPGAPLLSDSLKTEVLARVDTLRSSLLASLAQALAGVAYEAGSGAGKTDVWAMAQIVAALGPGVVQGNQFDSYFAKSFIADCACWAPIDGGQHAGATAWIVIAHAKQKRPLRTDVLEGVLNRQTKEGAWPLYYQASDRREASSTYATALTVFALSQLEAQSLLGGSLLNDKIKRAISAGRHWLHSNAPKEGSYWIDYPESNVRPLPSRGLSAFVVFVLLTTGYDVEDQRIFDTWFSQLEGPTGVDAMDTSDQFVLLRDGRTIRDGTRFIILSWELASIAQAYASMNAIDRIKAHRFFDDAMQGWSRADSGRLDFLTAETLFALESTTAIQPPPDGSRQVLSSSTSPPHKD